MKVNKLETFLLSTLLAAVAILLFIVLFVIVNL